MRWKRQATSAPPCLQSPQKRLKWDSSSMVAAMEEVKQALSELQSSMVYQGQLFEIACQDECRMELSLSLNRT